MEKVKNFVKKNKITIGVFIVIPLALVLFHQINLFVEGGRMEPIGQMVEVDGHQMHVFVDGDNKNAPLLVFLAGFGVPAPVFDFAPIRQLLARDYRIAVVERFGYGYSDIVNRPRDIDTILSDTRTALSLVGEAGPYILFPSSMAGVEAIRWAQLYPDEVLGIVGIDMVVPSFHLAHESALASEARGQSMQSIFTRGLGIHRFMRSTSIPALTEDEQRQARFLMRRNVQNRNWINEARAVVDNARTVSLAGIPDIPFLMFVSNEQDNAAAGWIAHTSDFATKSGGQIAFFDAGHLLHHYIADIIYGLSSEFIGNILSGV